MNPLFKAGLLGAGLSLFSNGLIAQLPNYPDVPLISEATDPKSIDLSFYSGYVSGKSQEIVYSQTDSGEIYRLSQLDWQIQNLWVIGGIVSANFLDNRLHFVFDGWGKAIASSSIMVDRDWLDKSSIERLTHISWSRSYLKTAYKLVGEMGYDFYQKKWGRLGFDTCLLTGYEYFRLFWEDLGGYYIYDSGLDFGMWPEQLGISYNQEFSIPYFGLQVELEWNEMIAIDLYGKFSWSAYVNEQDVHHLREIVFDDEFENGQYWMLGGAFSWRFWKNLECDLKYDYEQLNNAIGKITMQRADQTKTRSEGGGLAHHHQTLSLGLSAAF